MKLNEQDLTRRAFAAFYRSAAKQDGEPMQPSKYSGLQQHEGMAYVVLRNTNGILAVYRVRNDGKLKGLRRWPAALENG